MDEQGRDGTILDRHERLDGAYVLLSLAAGFLCCQLLLFGGWGVSVPIFTVVFLALALSYVRLGGRPLRWNRGAVFVTGFLALILLCFVLYDNWFLKAVNLMIVFLAVPLDISYLAGVNEYPFLSAGSLFDALKAAFVFPFANLDKGVRVIFGGKRQGTLLSVFKALAGILVSVPLLVIVVLLLANSDEAFRRVLSVVFPFLRQRFFFVLFEILVTVGLSLPIFSFLYSVKYKNVELKMSAYGISRRIRVIDSLFLNSALWVISMVYVLFIFTQLGYFFYAFRNMLPQKFTYAGYARKGFFELAAVCLINMLVIVFTIAFSKRRRDKLERHTKTIITVLSLLTLMLIATAVSKMVMYINNFGFTFLRVYASWLMLALGVLFLFFIIKMFNFRFKFIKSSAVCVMALYLGLNFANMDSFIPAYNITKYFSDRPHGVDIYMFDELSDSMVPQAVKLINDPVYKNETSAMLQNRRQEILHRRWQNFNFAQYSALKAIDGVYLPEKP